MAESRSRCDRTLTRKPGRPGNPLGRSLLEPWAHSHAHSCPSKPAAHLRLKAVHHAHGGVAQRMQQHGVAVALPAYRLRQPARHSHQLLRRWRPQPGKGRAAETCTARGPAKARACHRNERRPSCAQGKLRVPARGHCSPPGLASRSESFVCICRTHTHDESRSWGCLAHLWPQFAGPQAQQQALGQRIQVAMTRLRAGAHEHTHTHARTHTHAHTHTHTHTHTHMRVWLCLWPGVAVAWWGGTVPCNGRTTHTHTHTRTRAYTPAAATRWPPPAAPRPLRAAPPGRRAAWPRTAAPRPRRGPLCGRVRV
jgi:hypothetical protein